MRRGDTVFIDSPAYDLDSVEGVLVGMLGRKSDPTLKIFLVKVGSFSYAVFEHELKGLTHEKA